MTERWIEIEADTLDEAIKQAQSLVPERQILLSVKIINDGKPTSIKAVAETTEEAFKQAQKDFPNEDDIVDKNVLITPQEKVITVKAFDDPSAKSMVENEIEKTGRVISINKVFEGKKGFLGLGKEPNQYEAKIKQYAVVEIIYKVKTKISAMTDDVEKVKAYLLNYNPTIRKNTVMLMGSNNYVLVTQILVDLLGDVNVEVRNAVLKVIWEREKSVNCRYTVESLQDEIRYGHEGGMLGPTKSKQVLILLAQNAPDTQSREAIDKLLNAE